MTVRSKRELTPSMNGYVAGISNNKVIDKHVMSKYCKRCQIREPKKDTDEYENWKSAHICSINHQKCSRTIESAGAIGLFRRSFSTINLIYSEYLGDGNTSSFTDVVASKPNKKYTIDQKKLECIGHVQKSMGTRLHNLVKQYKGTSITIRANGKLTGKTINSLQNFYGISIRLNCDNISQMRKAISAILWRWVETDKGDENHHQFCRLGENSWCKYKKDQITKKNTYKKTINLPHWMLKILRPIFENLSKEELLKQCLHGKTQNKNESFNNIVWLKYPKTIFVNKQNI